VPFDVARFKLSEYAKKVIYTKISQQMNYRAIFWLHKKLFFLLIADDYDGFKTIFHLSYFSQKANTRKINMN
jgi:hypothetical protein